MSIEALAMAGVDCNKCKINLKERSHCIPSYLLGSGRTEEQEYRNYCKELDMAIRGLSTSNRFGSQQYYPSKNNKKDIKAAALIECVKEIFFCVFCNFFLQDTEDKKLITRNSRIINKEKPIT